LKITFLLPGYAPNPIGGYKVAYEYANYLATQGHVVRLVQAWRFSGDEAGIDQPLALAKRVRYTPEVLNNQRPKWIDLHPNVIVVNKFRATSADLTGSDVVVATACQSAPLANAYALSGLAGGVYFIQHYEDWSKDASFVDRTWKLPLRKIVIAPWLEEIGQGLGVRTDVVLNAIDSTKFLPGPPSATRPLSVAAMLSDHEWKRTDLVCEVLAQAKAQLPDMEATTFGVIPRPAELPAWVTYVQRPTRDQLSGIYQQVRVFLCASDKEGWGLPPGEAMQSGAAVVTTRNGGVDAYAEGVSLMAEPGDGATLAALVVRLLTDEDECARLAAAGQAKLSGYTEQDAGAAFEKILTAAAENYVGAW
jgi:glycosyltransferase involved in cell wall biosynthesis